MEKIYVFDALRPTTVSIETPNHFALLCVRNGIRMRRKGISMGEQYCCVCVRIVLSTIVDWERYCTAE